MPTVNLSCEFTDECCSQVIGVFQLLRKHDIPMSAINWMDGFLGGRHFMQVSIPVETGQADRERVVAEIKTLFAQISCQSR